MIGLSACLCEREDDEPGIYWDPGPQAVDGTRFASTPQDGLWLDYPGGRRYRMRHYLDVPANCIEVTPYIAFRADVRPSDPNSGANFTLGTGNVVTIEALDERELVIRNDTCTDFFLRVIARRVEGCGDASESEGRAQGAAGAAGATTMDQAPPGVAGSAGSAADVGAVSDSGSEPGAPLDAAPLDAAPLDAAPLDAAPLDAAPPVRSAASRPSCWLAMPRSTGRSHLEAAVRRANVATCGKR